MDASQFLQMYPMRAPNLIWMLGAGASAAANIPTADHMIWDFKRRLFCAAQRVPLTACSILSDPALKERLQQHFDSRGGYPPAGSEEEYAAYFEALYPNEADRRQYIERQVVQGTPSFGHMALAALLRTDRARMIVTPNFDHVVEDAVASVFGTTVSLTVATMDTAAVARQALDEGRWPLLIKQHGDFQSRRLKNTSHELRAKEQLLEEALIEACRRFGLAVVGYSGRDASIMATLEVAAMIPGSFPQGLFWFHRGREAPFESVSRLVQRAQGAGVDAHLIEIESFDELLSDVVLQFESWPPELQESLSYKARRVSDAPRSSLGDGYPVIRLNAIPVVAAPTTCRRIVCTIGGTREVREAVTRAQADLLVARRQVGVLIFGSDADSRRAFNQYGITDFDLHPIAPQRLSYDSAEHGLLTEAIARALSRERPLRAVRRRAGQLVAVDPAHTGNALFVPLRKAAKQLTGELAGQGESGTKRRWAEAAWIRLEQRHGRLWLLVEPTVWIDREAGERLDDVGKEFTRARLAGRYNAQVNALLDAWTVVFTGGADESTIRAFGTIAGVDAAFTLHKTAAYSRRITGSRAKPRASVDAALADLSPDNSQLQLGRQR